MTMTVLDRPTRLTPSRGVIAASRLKAAEQAALDTPRAPAIADREAVSSHRRSVPSLAFDSRTEVLWRWFIVAWLAAGYVLTGVAYFLG